MSGITKTRSDLRTMVYDEMRRTSSQIPETRVNQAINDAGALLHSIVEQFPGHRYNEQFETGTISAGASLTLPAVFQRVISIRYDHSDGSRPKIHRGTYENLSRRLANDTRDWHKNKVRYVIGHTDIEFDPLPEKAYTYYLHYIPSTLYRATIGGTPVVEMTSDSHVATLPVAAHRYIVLQAALILLPTHGDDTSHIQRQLDQWATAINASLARGRNVSEGVTPARNWRRRVGIRNHRLADY